MKNREWVLKSTPEGIPKVTDFEIIETEVPELKEGEILIKNEYISVDPYMRSRIAKLNPVLTYAKGHSEGERVHGATLGTVIESKSDTIQKGDSVVSWFGWQEYAVTPAAHVRKVDFEGIPKLNALNLMGMIGMTAYFGFLDICQPKEGETVLVSAAAGAVGLAVGQLAKIHGCRVIGTTSSDEKCKILKELGFDEAINYKTCGNLKEAVKNACPNGIDIFFDNVGGELLNIAVQQLNRFGRISLCGAISQYNRLDNLEPGPNLTSLVGKEGKIQGFLVGSFAKRYSEAYPKMLGWVKEGKLVSKETIFDGFDKVPEAFIALFTSANVGKVLIKI